jgi:hypothetical protein
MKRAALLALIFLLGVCGCEPKPPKPKTQDSSPGTELRI